MYSYHDRIRAVEDTETKKIQFVFVTDNNPGTDARMKL